MNYKRFEPHLIHVDVVDSTNNYAANLLKETKVANGTTILTKRQVSGRGQGDNKWHSEENKNLTFSTIVFPGIQARDVFNLNIAASLAVRKTLSDLRIDVEIKWPNDILVKGRKIAGILIENQISGGKVQSSIVGIGLNVNQTAFNEQINATSIKIEIGEECEISDVFGQLYSYLDFYMDHLMNYNFSLLRKLYYEHLHRLNDSAEYEDESGKFFGIILGLDDYGKLKVKKENGEIGIYDLKEIRFA